MRGLIFVIAASLLLAGCAPKAPQQGAASQTDPAQVYNLKRPELHYTPQDLEQARLVEYVGRRSQDQRNLSSAPLWGDQNQAEVAYLLAVLREASTVDQPLGDPQGTSPADSNLVFHYRDGSETWVTAAWKREPNGAQTWGPPHHYYLSGRGEVASGELDQLMRGGLLRTLLPPGSPLTAEPYENVSGGEITVRGVGWVGGSTARISLAAGGPEVLLAEVPVERGEFRWTGRLPQIRSTYPNGTVGIQATVAGVGQGGTAINVNLQGK